MNYNDLNAEIARCGLSIPQLAERMGVSKKTLYSRMQGKTDFSQGEMAQLAKILKLTDKKIIAIFFALKVS